MGKRINIIETVKNAVSQSLGENYMANEGTKYNLSSIESFNVADVGKDVLNSDTAVEKFTSALVIQLSKIVFIDEDVMNMYDWMKIDASEWGGFVERVYYEIGDVMESPMWSLVAGGVWKDSKTYAEVDHAFYQPKVSAKLYGESKAYTIPISIQRDELELAFRGYSEMESFISRIHQSIYNTVQILSNTLAELCINCGIAMSDGATHTSVDLHQLAIDKGVAGITTSTTLAQALENDAFLQFAGKEIIKIEDRMKMNTSRFNDGTHLTRTAKPRKLLLAEFARNYEYSVPSKAYNKEYVSLGDYDSVICWQAFRDLSKSDYDVDTCSTVSIAADPENKLGVGTAAYVVKGVIGFLLDERAMGISLFKRKITSNYTACADFWNEFHTTLINYIVDTKLNMVAIKYAELTQG